MFELRFSYRKLLEAILEVVKRKQIEKYCINDIDGLDDPFCYINFVLNITK